MERRGEKNKAKTPETFVTLVTPLPVACFPVEGKTVAEKAITGTITRLSNTTAEAILEVAVAIHSNVKMQLAPAHEPTLPEVYAKVVTAASASATAAATHVALSFTSVPEAAKTFLEDQRAAAQT